MAKIRLFVDAALNSEEVVALNEEQSHYLSGVMRAKIADNILLFNGKDGEFDSQIINIGKKKLELKIGKKNKEFEACSDIWLLFAPLKKDCTDFVIEKATELGVGKIIPTITKHAISDKVKIERFRSQAIEASEQCRRLDIPKIDDAQRLSDLLKNWDKQRKLYFMDETGSGKPVAEVFSQAQPPLAILIGPEGGFASEELDFLAKQDYTQPVSLGKLILRAETAAVAALSCWQAIVGNWKV